MQSRENDHQQLPEPTATSTPELEKQSTPSDKHVWISSTLSPVHELIFIALICASQFLTQAGFGQILFPVQLLGEGLGATSPGQLSWTVAGYSLTVGTFVLPAGRLGDMYGSKLMVMIGWAWFAFWSIIAGFSVFAPKGQGAVIMFCVCQGLRGIGPAILLPNAVAIAGRSYPNGQKKNMIFAVFAMCAPVGALVGGLFGSIFAQLAWWPWTLWSIGITTACMGVAVFFVFPADDKEEIPKGQKFDFIGAGLGVSGLILFNFAWNQATVVGWPEPYVPALLVVGMLIMTAFFLYEHRIEQPLLPPAVFNRGSVTILLVVGLGWASFGVFTFYTVQFVIVIRGYTPLGAIAEFTTLAVAGGTAAIATGLSIRYVPPPWMISIAAAAFTVGNILVATMPEHQIYWAQTFVGLIIMPFGMDISFPAASLVLSDMVPRHLQGVAASLVNTIINYSISIGLGVAGTAEREVRLRGASLVHGYRVALWVSVGMAGSSLLIALSFAMYSQFFNSRAKTEDKEKMAHTEGSSASP